MRLILVGLPGVGKGTQAELLCDRLELTHVSTGNVFRQEILDKTELGLAAASYLEAGKLVPDEVTIGMVERILAKPEIASQGFVLDGYPRSVTQAEALDKFLAGQGTSLDGVVSLSAPDDVVIARMLARGRADDDEGTIRKRLQVFRDQTRPVLDHYRELGVFVEVDADQQVEEVYRDIMAGICR
ncbi:MAG: adenylate kinase [Fimbriimonadaceae bacterium]